MKNIRILEDGNRLIVVLEGYERSALNALIDVLGTAATPLSNIRPHTGENQFQMKGTEKEILPTRQGRETSIKPPAFMEKMMANEGAKEMPKRESADASKGIPGGAAKETSKQDVGPAGQASSKCQEEKAPVPLAVPDSPMPFPEHGKDGAAADAVKTEEPDKALEAGRNIEDKETPEVSGQAGTTSAPTKVPSKPAEFMDSFELRAYIRQADKEKLFMILQKKGRFPNAAHLLNSDDRTIREYVKELLMTA